MIAAAAYGAAAALVRSLAWPLARPWPGASIVIAIALPYTAFSEWINVYVRKSWAYSELMPQVLGIGASPMLQWLLVPIAATLAVRWLNAPLRSEH